MHEARFWIMGMFDTVWPDSVALFHILANYKIELKNSVKVAMKCTEICKVHFLL